MTIGQEIEKNVTEYKKMQERECKNLLGNGIPWAECFLTELEMKRYMLEESIKAIKTLSNYPKIRNSKND